MSQTARRRGVLVEWRAPLIRLFRRLFTFLISILSAYVIFSILPLESIRHEPVPGKLVAVLLLVIASFIRVLLSRANIGLASEGIVSKNGGPANTTETISVSCMEAFQQNITAEEFEQFLENLIDPGGVVLRITETAQLGGRDFSTNVKRTVVPPIKWAGRKMYVPVLKPRKGELVDNFNLSVDGKPARTLSHRETVGATLATITTLLTQAAQDTDVPEELWRLLRDAVVEEGPTKPNKRESTLKELKACESTLVNSSDAALIARAALWKLVPDLFDTYLIIAVVPINGESLKVETRYTRRRDVYQVPKNKPFPIRWWQWSHIQLQLLFGLAVRSDEYLLPQATEAQSYHFRAEAPAGMYVYDVKSHWFDEEIKTLSPPFNTSKLARPVAPDWRAADTRGLDHLHAYGRDLDVWLNYSDETGASTRTSRRVAALRFELRERPPGVMFVIALLSVYVAMLAVGIGIGYDVIFGPYATNCGAASSAATTTSTTASPWPTILFGVPAIVSGWIVARFTADTVRLVSISTIAITTWAVVNTAYAVALSAIAISKPMCPVTGWLGIPAWQPAWCFLVISSCAATVMAVLLLVLRVRRYARRVRGKSPWLGSDD